MLGVFVARVRVLLLALSILGSRSARLARSQLEKRNSQVRVEDQSLARLDDAPPLEGCQSNFWDKTCCCFIDAGILQQSQCLCVRSTSDCEHMLRLGYSQEPSRRITAQWKRWFHPEKGGYLSGYQAVVDDYCMASPVLDDFQVDPFERSYDCTCSTAMGHNAEMQCGSSCTFSNCQASNPTKEGTSDFWSPFRNGRGRCCKSSYSSQTEGCSQELDPITEDRAKSIVTDALQHVTRGDKKAFLVKSSSDLVDDMTLSFVSAREKKMATSRSGSQFFFSGNYAFILKSINPSEYDILAKIAQRPLIDHIRRFRDNNVALRRGGYCTQLWIHPTDPMMRKDIKNGAEWNLRDVLNYEKFGASGKFFGYWNYNEEKSLLLKSTVYEHATGKHLAYWCPTASDWRIQDNELDAIDYSECEDRLKDPFFIYVEAHAINISSKDSTDELIETLYNDFIGAFREKRATPNVAHVTMDISALRKFESSCTEYRRHGSLINEFLIGFQYKDSYWMVVRNTVTAVQRNLIDYGFKEYQSNDLFDVKPFPIHSDERPVFFKMQFTKDYMKTWRNWYGVRENLRRDLSFMDTALDNAMVDYSMLISAFYINDKRMVLDTIPLPNCVERALRDVRSNAEGSSDYGDAPGSILVCFSIIDMLMEFTLEKVPENLILFNKWSDWSGKMLSLFDCLGNPRNQRCQSYNALRDPYKGVDIPSIESANMRDVSEVFTPEGDVNIKDPISGITSTWKCCCNANSQANVGSCVLADTKKTKEWYLGKEIVDLALGVALNSKGCGSLMGAGWHSFWRSPKKCVLSADHAKHVFRNAEYVF